MKTTSTTNFSVKRVLLTITLGSGITASVLHFMSMGHYPKTNDEQVIETIALWFGAAFVILTVCYALTAILYRKK